MRNIMALLVVVFGASGGCALNEGTPSGSWTDEQCPPVTEDNQHPRCHLRVPRAAVIIMPVEDRAREIWQSQYHAMHMRPFAGDVLAVIATDEQGGFTFLSTQDLATTGLSEKALWRQAERNVDHLARTASIEVYDDGVHWVSSDDVSASALVFSQSLWKREEFKDFRGPPLVGLDGRDHFLVADSSDARAIARVKSYQGSGGGCGALSNYPNFCSRAGHLFVRAPDGTWSVFAE